MFAMMAMLALYCLACNLSTASRAKAILSHTLLASWLGQAGSFCCACCRDGPSDWHTQGRWFVQGRPLQGAVHTTGRTGRCVCTVLFLWELCHGWCGFCTVASASKVPAAWALGVCMPSCLDRVRTALFALSAPLAMDHFLQS